MTITYFEDTDTLLLTLSDRPITETRDLGDDVLIVLADGSILRLSSKEGMTSFDAAALQKVIAKVD